MGVMVVLIIVMLIIGLLYQDVIPRDRFIYTMVGLGSGVAVTLAFLVTHIWMFSATVDGAINTMVERGAQVAEDS